MSVCRLILLQLNHLTADLLASCDADKSADVIVMGEPLAEATHVKHHKKKIAFLFSAARHFAADLRKKGWTVEYAALDGDAPAEGYRDLVGAAVQRHDPERIVTFEPVDFRLLDEMKGWGAKFERPVDILDDPRFVCAHDEFGAWAEGRKALRMEYFYREMRRKTGLLMDGDDPEGGQWNFDHDNRKPPKKGLDVPERFGVRPDKTTKAVMTMVDERFTDHFGDVAPFFYAVTAKDADAALDDFVDNALPLFGDYQDAMVPGEPFLFHAMISMYINAGLLDPLVACARAVAAYEAGAAPLNAVEGFVRQIIGWREYVRGIYWREGPDYVNRNALGADRPLPDFFWTGETDMACLRDVIDVTRENAYAHHIQRLMVTGNFALIAGLDPFAVHEWYLIVYADAFEWVEAPNVVGMALFADGGVLASKPYAASGAYINRMSHYCSGCAYKVSKKTEDDACPFNALYWDFMARNEKTLRRNPRIGRIYQNWDRLGPDKQKAYRRRAKAVLDAL